MKKNRNGTHVNTLSFSSSCMLRISVEPRDDKYYSLSNAALRQIDREQGTELLDVLNYIC